MKNLAKIMTIVMVAVLALSMSVSAASTTIYDWNNAEYTGSWWGIDAVPQEVLDGKNAISTVASSETAVICGNLKDAGAGSVDLSGYEYFTIDVYVSDAYAVTGLALDITSVKDAPVAEKSAKYEITSFTTGWQTIELKAPSTTGADYNAAAVYFIHGAFTVTPGVKLAFANFAGVGGAETEAAVEETEAAVEETEAAVEETEAAVEETEAAVEETEVATEAATEAAEDAPQTNDAITVAVVVAIVALAAASVVVFKKNRAL